MPIPTAVKRSGELPPIDLPIVSSDLVIVSRGGVTTERTTAGGIADLVVSDARLRLSWAYTAAFRIVSASRDSNGAIVTASIEWPDGATGTFTTDIVSTAFPGAIDAWHATHVLGAVTTTYTQTAVTRDASGAVTAQPAITVI